MIMTFWQVSFQIWKVTGVFLVIGYRAPLKGKKRNWKMESKIKYMKGIIIEWKEFLFYFILRENWNGNVGCWGNREKKNKFPFPFFFFFVNNHKEKKMDKKYISSSNQIWAKYFCFFFPPTFFLFIFPLLFYVQLY